MQTSHQTTQIKQSCTWAAKATYKVGAVSCWRLLMMATKADKSEDMLDMLPPPSPLALTDQEKAEAGLQTKLAKDKLAMPKLEDPTEALRQAQKHHWWEPSSWKHLEYHVNIMLRSYSIIRNIDVAAPCAWLSLFVCALLFCWLFACMFSVGMLVLHNV